MVLAPDPSEVGTSSEPQPDFHKEGVLAYVGLGANLGDARATLLWAAGTLAEIAGVFALSRSRLYRTAPWEASGPDYLNAVLSLRTTLGAHELLGRLQALEREAGRQRPYPNAPRTLDLDLLLYGEECIQSPDLTVPHPRMWQRAFVVYPLSDLAPQRATPDLLQSLAHQGISCLGSW